MEQFDKKIVQPSENEAIASHLIEKQEMFEVKERTDAATTNPDDINKPLSNEMKIELFFDEFEFVSSFRTGRTQFGKKPISKNVFIIRKDELASLIEFLSGRFVKVEKRLGKDTVAFGTRLYLKHYSDQDLMVQSKDHKRLEEGAIASIADNF